MGYRRVQYSSQAIDHNFTTWEASRDNVRGKCSSGSNSVTWRKTGTCCVGRGHVGMSHSLDVASGHLPSGLSLSVSYSDEPSFNTTPTVVESFFAYKQGPRTAESAFYNKHTLSRASERWIAQWISAPTLDSHWKICPAYFFTLMTAVQCPLSPVVKWPATSWISRSLQSDVVNPVSVFNSSLQRRAWTTARSPFTAAYTQMWPGYPRDGGKLPSASSTPSTATSPRANPRTKTKRVALTRVRAIAHQPYSKYQTRLPLLQGSGWILAHWPAWPLWSGCAAWLGSYETQTPSVKSWTSILWPKQRDDPDPQPDPNFLILSLSLSHKFISPNTKHHPHSTAAPNRPHEPYPTLVPVHSPQSTTQASNRPHKTLPQIDALRPLIRSKQVRMEIKWLQANLWQFLTIP